MNKKIYVSFAILLSIIFSFTFCFATSATDDMKKTVNDVRNFVGDAENTVENAALDISNVSKDVTGDMENGMNHETKNSTTGTITQNMSGQYSATRTSTDNTVMGMTSTAWTWIILAIVAIAIIALVWYYSMQITNNNIYNHHKDE